MSTIDVPHEGIRIREGLKPVLFVVSVAAVFFAGRSAFSPLLLDIEAAFGVSHTESSRLMVLFSAGYSVSMFLSGIVSQYLPHRRMIPLSAFIAAAAMVVLALAPDIRVMKAGLLLFGAAFGLFSPTAINMITSVVRREDWQRALSINELSPHIGMIAAPLFVAAARPILSWRIMFLLVALAFLLTAVFFLLRVKEGNAHGSAPTFSALTTLVRKPAFWLLIVFFSLALAGTDGVYLLIPTFLITEGGVDPRVANAVFGFSRFMPILALFLAALLFHRIGTRYAIVFALVGQGLAVLLLGVLTGPLRLVMVFLQPAIGALFFPAGFAALSGLMPRESRNVGISMVLPPAVFLGVGVIPAVVGYMGDAATFARGFVILGAVMTVIATTAFFVRFREDQ